MAVVDNTVMVSAESSAEDEKPEPKSERDYLKLAEAAYLASTTYFDANIRREMERDLRQWQSQHAADSKYSSPGYKGRSKLFRPKTRASIQKAEAQAAESLFSTVDVINILPEDVDDPLQAMQAKFKQSLIKPRLAKRSDDGGVDWYMNCMGAFQESLVVGLCISKSYWYEDPAKGISRPRLDLIRAENLRFDPACDWKRPAQDSPYLIERMPMYVRDIKAKYRDRVTDGQIMAETKQMQDSIRQQRDLKRTDSTSVSHAVNDFSIAWVYCNIIDVDGQDMHYYTLGTSAMLTEPQSVNTAFYHGRPYMIGFSTLEAHKQYPQSAVRLGRDLQKEINDLANQRVDNVNFVLNKRYFARRNRQVDIGSLTRNVIGSVTLMEDINEDVRVVETPDVTSSSYKENDLMQVEFDDIVGQFSQSSVQSNKNLNETVGGMQMLTNSSNQIGSYRLKNFVESWVEPVLNQLVEIERAYESDPAIIERAMRMAGAIGVDEESGQEYEIASMEQLFGGNHEVRVDMTMGATSPQEKANLLMFGFNALRTLAQDGILEQRGMDFQAVSKEIFSMLGRRDGTAFFKSAKDQDPRVAQLEQTVAELEQELANKQEPPELTQAKIEKLTAETERIGTDKLSKMVEAIYSAMQAGQVVASVPSVAPVADQILADAGFIPQNGVDPNLPIPDGPAPELSQRGVMDPMTGVGFVPGGEENPNIGTPEQALAADGLVQPDDGEGLGIETPQADGVR